MSMVVDKDVPSQGFGEVSNMIIGTDWENFNLPMLDMFTKMMIACIDMLCVRMELGELCKFQSTCIILKLLTEHMRFITDNLEVMTPDLCYQVHDEDHISYGG